MINDTTENAKYTLTFAAVMDSRKSVCAWAEYDNEFRSKVKWIIFDRSEDAVIGTEAATLTLRSITKLLLRSATTERWKSMAHLLSASRMATSLMKTAYLMSLKQQD